jgi:hypothetical protein
VSAKRIVTAEQLQAGFVIRWPDGREQHCDYVVLKALPNFRYEVEEPTLVGAHFVFGAKS